MTATERFQRLRPEKKEKIVATAIDEFARYGFRQASVNRMARLTGIAKGSLFQYFGTKEGLFRFIFDHAVELVRRNLRRVKAETADQDFFERIRSSLLAGISFIRKHPHIYQIYLKMLFQEDFPFRDEFLQKIRLFSAEYLTPLVEKGMADGDLRPDLDVHLVVFTLDAVMDRFLQAHCVPFLDGNAGLFQAPPERVEKQVGDLVDFLRRGLGAENPPGADDGKGE